MMRFGGSDYSIQIASDLARDGLILEIWRDFESGKRELVAEVHYSDALGQMTFSAFLPDLPFELIEHLSKTARLRLTPTTTPNQEAAE